MRILVIGKTGQLASHLRDLLPEAEFWGREQLDWTSDQDHVQRIVDHQPQVIINATAYTAVDLAESEPELAFQVNEAGPERLALAARATGARLIHISTDYVFSGLDKAPYDVSASLEPHTVYGQSKLAGERAIMAAGCDAWVIRVSWLFGEHGKNFVKTMLSLSARDNLQVVADQRGRPTYAGYLAQTLVALAKDPNALPPGLYHFDGGPSCSWFEFASSIFEAAREAGVVAHVPAIESVTGSDFPSVAPRPANSVLEPSQDLMALAPAARWEQGLAEMLAKLSPSQ